jgi:hypothetical protein
MPGKLYYTIESPSRRQRQKGIPGRFREAGKELQQQALKCRYTLQGIHGPSSCDEECLTHPSSEVRAVFFELF